MADNDSTEFEQRILHLEEWILYLAEQVRRMADQVGQMQQNENMQRTPFGAGRAPRGAMSAVSTTIITAAPSTNVLGKGTATLRIRDGDNLTNGRSVTVHSNFSVAVPSGIRLEVVPDEKGFKLVGADCPP